MEYIFLVFTRTYRLRDQIFLDRARNDQGYPITNSRVMAYLPVYFCRILQQCVANVDCTSTPDLRKNSHGTVVLLRNYLSR